MFEAEVSALAEHALWTQDVSRLAGLPDTDPRSWIGSVQQDLKRHGIDVLLPWPTSSQPASFHVAAVMLVKDEADIIHLNLEWLYYMGLRRFAICDNGSTDGTKVEIERFRARHSDSEVVTILDPLVRYMQSEKTTATFRWALTMWPDVRWVFPIDADEFLVPSRGLGTLDQLPPDIRAITIPKAVHFRHRLGGEPAGGNPLSKMGLRSKPFIVPTKSACRAELDLLITQGNHNIKSMSGNPVGFAGGFSLGFYYREFQTRSYEHFRRKVINGGQAILAAQQHTECNLGGEHWLAWYDTLQTGGDDALHRAYEAECVREPHPHFVYELFDAAVSR